MKEVTIKATMTVCRLEELPEADQQLVLMAKDATRNSYSPYSHFSVGAALRLADGTLYMGANQENAAFPVGLCAERTALFAAQAQHPEQPVEAIAIAARNVNGFVAKAVSPCGSCRQAILEVENRYQKPIRILLYGTEGIYVVNSIRDLLPLYFVEESMH